eukprot:3806630-Pyramimonas_sp.AAC.1
MIEEIANRKLRADRQEQDAVKHYQEELVLPLRRETRRRLGPWRIVEIFAWACQRTILAVNVGWDAHQPITAPAFDLLT